MSAARIAAKLPEVYADPKAWVVTGTKGIFAYPRGAEENSEMEEGSLKGAMQAALQRLIRMVLGI